MKEKQPLFNREKIEKQLKELGNKIDELNARVREETKLKYNETIETLQTQIDETFKKVNNNIDSQLNEWGDKIEKLTGKVKEEAKKEYEEIRKNVYLNLEEYKKTLNELKGAGSGALAEIKTGAVKAWKEIKNSLNNALSKFK